MADKNSVLGRSTTSGFAGAVARKIREVADHAQEVYNMPDGHLGPPALRAAADMIAGLPDDHPCLYAISLRQGKAGATYEPSPTEDRLITLASSAQNPPVDKESFAAELALAALEDMLAEQRSKTTEANEKAKRAEQALEDLQLVAAKVPDLEEQLCDERARIGDLEAEVKDKEKIIKTLRARYNAELKAAA